VTIAACLKWVDRRPEVDPLTGAVRHDVRAAGASDADLAALEWALRMGEAWGDDVLAITAGPAAADGVLRDALAVGATTAVRVDVPAAASEAVAMALAGPLRACRIVVCGDLSLDRGSGSVPAYLAARLDAVQALGLVGVDVGEPGSVTAVRRLDGGRRERLLVTAPAVCSVEGSTARLRRAGLSGVLAARHGAIEVVPGHAGHGDGNGRRASRPFRPRARALPAPAGDVLDRLHTLTAAPAGGGSRAAETLEPDAAAARIVAALTDWGYGPAGDAAP
jgi:electron transfer flavoprotein beta subunit